MYYGIWETGSWSYLQFSLTLKNTDLLRLVFLFVYILLVFISKCSFYHVTCLINEIIVDTDNYQNNL